MAPGYRAWGEDYRSSGSRVIRRCGERFFDPPTLLYIRGKRWNADSGAVAIVEQNGAISSELPLGAPPSPQNFPSRNRVIAGMSLGVTVVEAAEHSGSLITVRFGLESGGEVALPGNITSPQSWGPHALIGRGAKLCGGWRDVVGELPHIIREKNSPAIDRSNAGCA